MAVKRFDQNIAPDIKLSFTETPEGQLLDYQTEIPRPDAAADPGQVHDGRLEFQEVQSASSGIPFRVVPWSDDDGDLFAVAGRHPSRRRSRHRAAAEVNMPRKNPGLHDQTAAEPHSAPNSKVSTAVSRSEVVMKIEGMISGAAQFVEQYPVVRPGTWTTARR